MLSLIKVKNAVSLIIIVGDQGDMKRKIVRGKGRERAGLEDFLRQ